MFYSTLIKSETKYYCHLGCAGDEVEPEQDLKVSPRFHSKEALQTRTHALHKPQCA